MLWLTACSFVLHSSFRQVLKKFTWATENGKPVLLRWVQRDAGLASLPAAERQAKGHRWCKVVPVEEVPALVVAHHERAVGTCGIQALYKHVSWSACRSPERGAPLASVQQLLPCARTTTTTNTAAACTAGASAVAVWPGQAPTNAPGLHPLAPLQLSYKVPSTVTLPNGDPLTVDGLEGFDRDCLKFFLEASPVHADQAATKPSEKPPVTAIRVVRAFQQVQVGDRGLWVAACHWSGWWVEWLEGWSIGCQLALPRMVGSSPYSHPLLVSPPFPLHPLLLSCLPACLACWVG